MVGIQFVGVKLFPSVMMGWINGLQKETRDSFVEEKLEERISGDFF